MSRVVHFEIPLANPEKTGKFYQDVFGWTIKKWDGPSEYWLVTTGPKEQPGIDGGLMRPMMPGQGTVNTMDVANVDQAIRTIESKGGKVVKPKMPIPGMGWFAYCTDPEGNIFGIMQMDPKAK